LAATPSLIKKPSLVIKKLYGAIFYKGDSVDMLKNSFLLSSLAVDPYSEGRGIGKFLIKDLNELLSEKRTSGSVLGFYNKCGFSIESEFNQSGQREMLRLIKSVEVV